MLLFHFKTLESTHSWMKSRFSEICDVKSPSVISAAVTAEKQTKAKGRHSSNNWQSTPGGIYCSFLLPLKDQMPRQKWGVLPLLAASSLCSTMKKYTSKEDLYLKWPNDVFCGDGKLGISIVETIDSHCEYGFAIISMYANLVGSRHFNQEEGIYFASLSENKAINTTVFFQDLSKTLITDIKTAFLQKEDVFIKGFEDWKSKAGTLNFQYEGKHITGSPINIFSDGSLVVHTETKQQIVVNSNEPVKIQY